MYKGFLLSVHIHEWAWPIDFMVTIATTLKLRSVNMEDSNGESGVPSLELVSVIGFEGELRAYNYCLCNKIIFKREL